MVERVEFKTSFPAHAVAEMKRSRKQRAYWEAWAAVGDAKLAEAEASQQVIDVENDWHACCIAHQINLPSCGCGEHPARYLAARNERDARRADVAAAIETFKAV